MFLKATITQTTFMLKQKGTLFVFYCLLAMVLLNFVTNVLTFQNSDVVQMYHPMKLLLLSYNRVNYNADATLLLIQLYPLLVVCPAGFSLAREHQTGQEVMIVARLGQFIYKLSKLLSAFLTTAIVFCVPFLVEILLNCISFPLSATGDLTNWGFYNPAYIQSVYQYTMSGIFLRTPIMYTIIGTLIFGLVSGALGAFTVGFSSIVQVKYRVFLFLPVFLFLNATVYIAGILPDSFPTTKWYDYLLLYNDQPKSLLIFITAFLTLVLFSIGSTLVSSRKELL